MTAVVLLLAVAARADAATIAVTTTNDVVNPSDGLCSLREAVTAANTNSQPSGQDGECHYGSGDDTISLGAATYTLDQGVLTVTSSIRFKGQGETVTTVEVSTANRSRAIVVPSTAAAPSVSVESLEISGAEAAGGSGNGGAILDQAGDLTLSACRVNHSEAGDGSDGGGTGGFGGAVYFEGGGTLTVNDCYFFYNLAGTGGHGRTSDDSSSSGRGGRGGNGGAIATGGNSNVTITNSSFSGNLAGRGGSGGDAGDSDNESGADGGAGGSGGAVYLAQFNDATISGTQFATNYAGRGGAGGAGDDDGTNGHGGLGGSGGAVLTEYGLVLSGDRFVTNFAGDGGLDGAGPDADPNTSGVGGNGGALVKGLGDLTVTETSFSRNYAGNGTAGYGPDGGNGGNGGNGGAVYSPPFGGDARFDRSSFDNNRAGKGGDTSGDQRFAGQGGSGGAIYTEVSLALENTTIDENHAGRGGDDTGIDPYAGGPGGLGGALFLAGGTVTATHVTVSDNESGIQGAKTGTNQRPEAPVDEGGAVATSSGRMSFTSSILTGNGPFACSGKVTARDSDTIAYEPVDPSCPGRNVDPKLEPLGYNGGTTQTRALDEDSPAIDFGAADSCPATDQRGVSRPQGAGCDAGAFEREYVAPPAEPQPEPQPDPEPEPQPAAPAPEPQPESPPPPPPATGDQAKPHVTLFLSHKQLRAALLHGYGVSFMSDEKGTASVQLLVGRSTAARGSKRLAKPGKQRVIARFTANARKKYAKAKRLRLTVRVRVTDAAGNETTKKQSITLKR